MIKDLLAELEDHMKKTLHSLEMDLTGIRTGRASPALIERLMVNYYDTPTQLQQLALISAPEPQLLTIRPYDMASLKDIERAIQASDLGLTPHNDGKIIRLPLPPLTEARRNELTKVLHRRLEETRIALRNVRRDGLKDAREFEKEHMISEDDLSRAEDEIQKLMDKYTQLIATLGERKENEIRSL